jgi:exodeoxyribonuclease-3
MDYHLATPALAALAKTEHIYKAQRFSDHAPITVIASSRSECRRTTWR